MDHLPERRRIRLDRALYESAHRVYFLTICTKNSERCFADPALSREVVACLLEEAEQRGILIFAYCLMSNHLHVLCAPMTDGISVIDFVDAFKGKSTRISWKHGIDGHLWERGYFDRIMRRQDRLEWTANYILNNPVQAGIVGVPSEYEFAGTPVELPGWW